MQLVSFCPPCDCSSIPGQNGVWEYHSLSFKCPERDCDYRCIRFNSFERHILKYHNARSVQDYKPDDFIDYDTITYGTQEECRKLARRKKLTWEPGKLKTKKMKGKERYSEDNENDYEEMEEEGEMDEEMKEEEEEMDEEMKEEEEEEDREKEDEQEQKPEGKEEEEEQSQEQEEQSGSDASISSEHEDEEEDKNHKSETAMEK